MAEERQTYSEISPWWGEHVHRYYEALKLINEEASVLDLACGNGFGSFLLSQNTSGHVVGGDIDSETIKECKKLFKNENLLYAVLDATSTSYPDDYFDAVVSFETIEHSTEYKKICSEFYRVLSKNGRLVLSTPNFPVNSPKKVIENPYHTQEFTLSELKNLLSSIPFRQVKFYGQKYVRYDSASFKTRVKHRIENLLYFRGIRKFPQKFKDFISRILIGKKHYPDRWDYELVEEDREIQKCKTFFVVCIK